jgi:glycosyltransferase involved in cell wall biosynthesis
VVAHHTWLARENGAVAWRDRLKRLVVRKARNIAISEAVRHHLAVPAIMIGNPYRDWLFRVQPEAVRDRDLVFLGRLVSDKGVDLLFHALVVLRQQGLTPGLTVIGRGPEETPLRRLSKQLDLESQVTFAGQITGEDLVTLLNRHRLIVAPSRWQEPFGLSSLEGIACGCVALAANCGGLPEAVGAAGVVFRHNDAEDAARWIAKLLAPGADLAAFRAAGREHLARHSPAVVAAKYLRVMEEALDDCP